MPSPIAPHTSAASGSTVSATTRTIADLKPLESKRANAANAPFVPGTALLYSPAFARIGHRPTKSKPGKNLVKSQSTPHLRGCVTMSESELQAKRNKLGYQRISIACAHCRRRKIRCLMVDDESEGRCANCIRLKKECVFYPVDQQAAIDAQAVSSASGRTKNGSRASSSVSNSPPVGASRPLVQRHHSGGNAFPISSADEMAAYRGIPIAPSHSQPPPGSMSAPIPQHSRFEQSSGQFAPAQYGYAPHGDVCPMDHHAPNYSRPIPVTNDAHHSYTNPPPTTETAFSSPIDAPQYTHSPIDPYDYPSHTPQHAQWPLHQPPVVRSTSYSGPLSSYPPQQHSGMYTSALARPEQHPPPANHTPPQHDARMVQYSNYPAPLHMSAGQHNNHAYMQPWPPQYQQHYQPVQPLQSNWFGETNGNSQSM